MVNFIIVRWAAMRRDNRRWLLPWVSLSRWGGRGLFVLGAGVVGLAAILFSLGGNLAGNLQRQAVAFSPYLPLVLMPAGFALLSWVSRKFFPGTEGSGIPQTIAALDKRKGSLGERLLTLRVAFAKIGLTLGGLACGAAVGREGPTIQVGAALMRTLAAGSSLRRLASERNVILAGAAAGIAAAFNTPLAGILFAIEELSRFSVFRANSTILMAVIFAGLISLVTLGNYTYFGHSGATLQLQDAWLTVLACGLVGGVAGGAFSRLLQGGVAMLPKRLRIEARERPVRFAAYCGLAAAILGVASGGITYGTGYEEARNILEGDNAMPPFFGVAKMAAIYLAGLCAIPGGVLAPTLAVGAGLGANVAMAMPGEPAAAIAVLAMGGYLAGVTQAPITSFVIVMEMSDNHEMLLPLMAVAVVANGVARTISPLPLYHGLAKRIGRAHA